MMMKTTTTEINKMIKDKDKELNENIISLNVINIQTKSK